MNSLRFAPFPLTVALADAASTDAAEQAIRTSGKASLSRQGHS